MSHNLTLAFETQRSRGEILCYDRHALTWQDPDTFALIKADAFPLSECVMWYEDEGLNERHEDQEGNPLTYILAHILAQHLSTEPLNSFDAATLAYLNALPPDTRVVLWWH